MGSRQRAFLLCLVPFIVLATLNSGGYRYGASDQAFYLPAIFLDLDPELFPRDAALLTAQTKLTVIDDVIGSIVRFTGMSLPHLFLAFYFGALGLLAWGVWRTGTSIYSSTWTVVALLFAVTLRHAIARSGTNTLEGYFHPRVLAFAVGTLAVSTFLRGRLGVPFVLLALTAVVHPTTALWFIVWLTTAAAIARPDLRRSIAWGAAVTAAVGLWALTLGPLGGRLAVMDPEWRDMLASKEYLFPLEWPPYAWILNLAYLPLIAIIYWRRARVQLVQPLERALVLGSLALAAVFAVALVLHAVRVVIAIQLQPARVFWMFDVLATVHLVWAIAESGVLPLRKAPVAAAVLLIALSTARGMYVLIRAERPPMEIGIGDDDWGRAMAFVRSTAKDSSWLADPLHAALYGTSLRVAGERDVFVEALKDSAIGMYDRNIAVRTAERFSAVRTFLALTTDDFKQIAQRYDLDFIITEHHLDLPLAFESGPLRIYRFQ